MKNHKWTAQEESLLAKSYPNCTPEELSLLLEMPWPRILSKALKMGLRRSQDYTARVRLAAAKTNLSKMNSEQGREKRRQGIREMIRKERLRVKYGLKQRTQRTFSTISQAEQRQKDSTRHGARKRGYEINDQAKALFYTERTKRSERTEQYFRNNGYEIIEKLTPQNQQEQ